MKTSPSNGFVSTPLDSLVERFREFQRTSHELLGTRLHFLHHVLNNTWTRTTAVHVLFTFETPINLFGHKGLIWRLQDIANTNGTTSLISLMQVDFADDNLLAQGILALHDDQRSPSRNAMWADMLQYKIADLSAASSPLCAGSSSPSFSTGAFIPSSPSRVERSLPSDPRRRGFNAPSLPRPSRSREPSRARERSRSVSRPPPPADPLPGWSPMPVPPANEETKPATGLLLSMCTELWGEIAPSTAEAQALRLHAVELPIPRWIFDVDDMKPTIQPPRLHDPMPGLTVVENSLTYFLLTLSSAMLPCAKAVQYASIAVRRMLESSVDTTQLLSADIHRAFQCCCGISAVLKTFSTLDLSKHAFLDGKLGKVHGGGSEWMVQPMHQAVHRLGPMNHIRRVYEYLHMAHQHLIAMNPENGLNVRWDRIAAVNERLKDSLVKAGIECQQLLAAMTV